nr:MAG TPA: hypothetical protein [Caudoviricetes sp.]
MQILNNWYDIIVSGVEKSEEKIAFFIEKWYNL